LTAARRPGPSARAAGRARGAARRPRSAGGNAGGGWGVLDDMTLPILILFGAGTLLPCLGLWLADQSDRIKGA